jgi:hypothetical protein
MKGVIKMLKTTLLQTRYHITRRNSDLRKWLAAVCALVILFASSQPGRVAAGNDPILTQVALTQTGPDEYLIAIQGENLCSEGFSNIARVRLEVAGAMVPTSGDPTCQSDGTLNQPTGGLRRITEGEPQGYGKLTLVTLEDNAFSYNLFITARCDGSTYCVYNVRLVD